MPKANIVHQPGDKYLVVGYYYNTTRRFRNEYTNPHYALAINLWRGRVYQVRDGKRTLIKEVYN